MVSTFRANHKDCVGAIDETRARVCNRLHNRFLNRNFFLSQNVMIAVGFNMRFLYVLASWEGSASDSKVLYDAISNEHNRLAMLEGKYYLVDGGYPTMRGFIGPYRRVCYHLNEFTSSPRALQNHKVGVVIACAILYSYIMMTWGADSIRELYFRRRVKSQLLID
ncbi:uncharacterized protein LOC110008130 [Amborella trichopoda]|uniref:uncharacterized protein LOC110008130 n=1 Tax=Amborella trichopoda TaxID=13333 RepID=UPI0009BF8629|nr:uncharacterized protein LOC110008130 [Amborella trichopoda]|eukprot:XP_020529422.1 uncharacterized protein LOC110008130 [Amborella trichopoda]